MDEETVRIKMMEQINKFQNSAMTSEFGWNFEVEGFVVYITMSPRKSPESTYILNVAFDEYPRDAPSYVFVDPISKECTDNAWPSNVRHGAQPPGICTPGTREFHKHYHVNDQGYRWDPEQYSLLDTVYRIFQLMEKGIG